MKNDLILSVPEEILESSKVSPKDAEKEFLKESALALYSRDILALGKARSLAIMTRWEFEEILGEREILRHYQQQDIDEDISYGRSSQ